MSERPRLVGMNHVALEVGDVDEAVAWYGRSFSFALRGRGARMAFLDMGDQFLALSAGRTQAPDDHRHLGLVVDDLDAARRALERAGAEILPGRGLDFRDPWGNRVQVVAYADIQFTKAPEILGGMGLGALEKTERALSELEEKGLGKLPGVEPGSLTADELARLLREAEQAHGAYERELGKRDEDWPSWYARWILERLEERGAGPGP